MPSTDNRPARQTLLVLAAIAAATFVAYLTAGKWAAVVPLVLVPAWRLARRAGTRGAIATQGWSGRRFKNYWVYEEQQGADRPSLSLRLEFHEPDRYVLVIPGAAEWRRTMPLWAAGRRDEIIARVATAWAPEDVRWPAGEGPADARR
jgi:hypothetical protein